MMNIQSRSSIESRIPVSQKCKNNTVLIKEKKQKTLTQTQVPPKEEELRFNKNGLAGKSDIAEKIRETTNTKKRYLNSNIFVWQTRKEENKLRPERKDGLNSNTAQEPFSISFTERRKENEINTRGSKSRQNASGSGEERGNGSVVNAVGDNCISGSVDVDMERKDVQEIELKHEGCELYISEAIFNLRSDDVTPDLTLSDRPSIPAVQRRPDRGILQMKDTKWGLEDTNEHSNRNRYEYRRYERRNTGSSNINENNQGHYFGNCGRDQRQITEREIAPVAYRENDPKGVQDQNAELRAQIEKLSSFVDNSEERRERSEIILMQQEKELEKVTREKEMLKNKVCCLEELRRNLQQKLETEMEESKSLKKSIKNAEEKLMAERQKVKDLKRECSSEISKNAELELVLQTLIEELSNANELLKTVNDRDKKVTRAGINASSPVGYMVKMYPKYSTDYCKRNSEEIWKREKSQFTGKIKLLEMDKSKLRNEIGLLQEKIIEHERIGCNLRENNDVLEFRIAELEYQVLDLSRKNNP